MSKDLSKVKAGDFVRSNGGSYGLVIDTSSGLKVIYQSTHGSVSEDKEYRRLEDGYYGYQYIPKHWEESFKRGKDVFKDEIKVDIYINGKIANLSDISEETLIKLRKEN